MQLGVRRWRSYGGFVVPKLWHILSNGYRYLNGVIGAFACVILSQSFPQAIRLHAYDRISVLIEGIAPVKEVEGDGIFLDPIGFAGECLLANIREQVSQRRRTGKKRGLQHGR
jgi:hypothetical protein